MKTVTILSDFDGYPEGEKRRFVAGETPTLPATYADLLIGKKLAAKIPATAPSARPKKEKRT